MKGVFNKPYVCLDQYIDIPGLLDLIPDINYGIARSHEFIKPNFATAYQTNSVSDKESVKDFGAAFRCWENDTDDLRKQRGAELLASDPIAFEYWLEYEYNVVEVMSYLVLRDYEKPFNHTYEPLDALKPNNFKFAWNPCVKNFTGFKQWCEKLPFKQMGPVVFLLKTAGTAFPLHTDEFYNTTEYDHKEQFIWLDPRRNRSLYVLDGDTKHMMDQGVSYYWNNHDYHGGIKSIDRMSWAIRIEGIFDDQLTQKLIS